MRQRKIVSQRIQQLSALSLLWTVSVSSVRADEQSVQPNMNPPEQMPVPVMKPLQGSIEQSGLQGGAQGAGLNGGAQSNWGNMQRGTADQWQTGPLQGSAASQAPLMGGVVNDPDYGNQEIQIQWDAWRNNLMQSIQNGTLAKINVHNDVHFVWDPRTQMMQTRYPQGLSAWYSCDVLPNRRIVNIRLVHSSRYPSYDQAVLQSINDLQGSSVLTYPPGSRRTIVTQEAGVKTAETSAPNNFQFGDVERQRF